MAHHNTHRLRLSGTQKEREGRSYRFVEIVKRKVKEEKEVISLKAKNRHSTSNNKADKRADRQAHQLNSFALIRKSAIINFLHLLLLFLFFVN